MEHIAEKHNMCELNNKAYNGIYSVAISQDMNILAGKLEALMFILNAALIWAVDQIVGWPIKVP